MSEERKKLSTAERILLLAFYLFFGGVGAMYIKHSTDATKKLAHFEQLPRLRATDFKNSVPGHQVAIEGHVSKLHLSSFVSSSPIYVKSMTAGMMAVYFGLRTCG